MGLIKGDTRSLNYSSYNAYIHYPYILQGSRDLGSSS